MISNEKKPKVEPVVEESVFLRVLWFLLALTCLTMIADVDKNTSGLTLGSFNLPLIVVYLWMCISGCFLTYHFRRKQPPWLTALGLCGIFSVVWWFVGNLKEQWYGPGEINILLPTLHMVAGLFVSQSFELRTRGDFNFSVALSLVVMFMTSTLGKGLVFGCGMIVYLTLAGIMLLLDCESRTFGNVCERGMDGLDLDLVATDDRGEKTANLLFPVGCMMAISLCLFTTLPRAEAIADLCTAQIYAMFRPRDPAGEELLRRININNPLKHPGSRSGKDKTGKKPGARPVGDPMAPDDSPQVEAPESQTGKKPSSDKQSNSKDGKDKGEGENKKTSGKSDKQSKTGSGKTGEKGEQKDPKSTSDKPNSNPNNKTPDPNSSKNKNKDKDKAKPSNNQTSQPGKDTLPMEEEVPTEDDVAFTVECNRTVYYKQSAFDHFDGKTWANSRPDVKIALPRGGETIYRVPALPSEALPREIPAIQLKQTYKCKSELGNKLPVAGVPEAVVYAGPQLFLDSCGTIKSSWTLARGTSYVVIAKLPLYDLKKLRQAQRPDAKIEKDVQEGLDAFLQLPDDHDDTIVEMTKKITGKDGNWFCQCEKICNHLRSNYSATSEKATADGNCVNDFLLSSKLGNCKQFAAAFTIMCRSVGIPARVVVGFSSGEFEPGSGLRQIKIKHGHAWAEAFIPGAGWVPFDAMPGGTMPERIGEQEQYINSINKQLESSLNNDSAPAANGNQSAKKNWAMPTPGELFSIFFKSVPGLLLLAIVASTAVALLKSLRSTFSERRKHPASKLYGRFLGDLRQVGVVARSSDTAEDIRRKVDRVDLKSETSQLKESVEQFLLTYNRVYFGEKPEYSQLDNLYQEFRSQLKNSVKARTR